MPEYQRTYLVDCGGINNSKSDELIADNELSDAANIIPDFAGSGNLVDRPGLVANSAPAATYPATAVLWPTMSGYRGKHNIYYCEPVTTSVPAFTFNIYDIVYNAGGTGTATSRYNDTTDTSITQSWCSFASYDLFADGYRYLKTSNGTAFTAISNIPASTAIIHPYNNYLFAFVLGGTSLRWSDEEDPETWDVAHDMKFALEGAFDSLRSLRVYNSELAIFSKRRIVFVQGYGPLDFTVTRTIENVGVLNHRTTCTTPYGLFWWDILHGLAYTRDGVTVDFPMVRKMQSTYSTYASNQAFGGDMFWCPERLCVSCVAVDPDGPVAYGRVDYYPLNDSLYFSSYLESGSSYRYGCAIVDDQNFSSYARPVYYFVQRDKTASTGKSYVRREDEDVSTDVGSAVTAYLETKRVWGPTVPIDNKEANKVMLTTKLGTEGVVTYGYYANNATTLTDSWGPTVATGVQDTEFGINANYRKVKHRVSNALAGRVEYHALHEIGD